MMPPRWPPSRSRPRTCHRNSLLAGLEKPCGIPWRSVWKWQRRESVCAFLLYPHYPDPGKQMEEKWMDGVCMVASVILLWVQDLCERSDCMTPAVPSQQMKRIYVWELKCQLLQKLLCILFQNLTISATITEICYITVQLLPQQSLTRGWGEKIKRTYFPGKRKWHRLNMYKLRILY